MRNIKSLLFLAVFLITIPSFADGMDVGARIKAVQKSGNIVEGTVAGFNGDSFISLFESTGHYFKVPMSKIKSIVHLQGQYYYSAGGTKADVVMVTTTDGQTVNGGIYSNSVVILDMGIKGKRNLFVPDPSSNQSIELVEQPVQSVPSMKIRLMNGEIISVPVNKADIQSIYFE